MAGSFAVLPDQTSNRHSIAPWCSSPQALPRVLFLAFHRDRNIKVRVSRCFFGGAGNCTSHAWWCFVNLICSLILMQLGTMSAIDVPSTVLANSACSEMIEKTTLHNFACCMPRLCRSS